MARLLLADDDEELSDMLAEYLRGESFDVDIAHNGEDALAKALRGDCDLVILDVMMPRLNGFDVLRELRRKSLIPVLMLTARGSDMDSVVGLELGADDYLPKPCNPRVLVARIRAVLRRAEQGEPDKASGDLVVGDVVMQRGSRRILQGGVPVELTSTEYSVLAVLLEEVGRVVSKEALCEHALGRKLTRYDRALDMHISNLRRKLGPLAGGEERIQTVRGVGYLYARVDG
ncbi:MAG: response regulator transcription factor [Gammaproteobacteria bacterium]|nr:response regulator transcription factor [Gammaproteobacteria bacterium]